MRTLHHFTSLNRWHAVAIDAELAVGDELSVDPDRPLGDDTRVRITVTIPNRDASEADGAGICRATGVIYFPRWRSIIDMATGDAIPWEAPMLVCSPPRSEVLKSRRPDPA